MLSYEEFQKTELKTAKIMAVNDHPNADRLYVLEIKVGEMAKTIVAGIRKFYTPEELIGKTIVIVNNLEPAVIRGVESCGMLLGVSEGDNFSLLVPEREVTDGLEIR